MVHASFLGYLMFFDVTNNILGKAFGVEVKVMVVFHIGLPRFESQFS